MARSECKCSWASICCAISVFLFFLAASLYVKSYFVGPYGCGPWIPMDIDTIPRALPGDTIEVMYLTVPLLQCAFGHELSLLNGYHAGIGLTNTRTLESYTINYDAYPTFTGALYPNILRNGTLQWSNKAGVMIYQGVNYTFWDGQNELAALLTGNEFNQLLDWMVDYNATHPFYELFQVWGPNDDGKSVKLFDNQDCFTFGMHILGHIRDIKGTLLSENFKTSYLSLYSKEPPKKVDQSDKNEMDRVNKFFTQLHDKIEKGPVSGLSNIVYELAIENVFYARKGLDYYKIDTTFPYFETHYRLSKPYVYNPDIQEGDSRSVIDA